MSRSPLPVFALVSLLAALGLACTSGRAAPPAQPEEEERPPGAPGWARPILDFEESPPTGHAGMYAIVRDRVGPLYAEMPAELRFLQRVFTDFEVRREIERRERDRRQRVFEIYDRGSRLLVVEPEEEPAGETSGASEEGGRPPREIARVRVESSLFRSPEGAGVGDRFEDIARVRGPLECRAGQRPGGGEPVALCRASTDRNEMRWIFRIPDAAMPSGWLSSERSEDILRGARALEVWWRPPEN